MAVADGCSATPSAEVGATLTARAIVYRALRWAEEHPTQHPSHCVHTVVDEVLRGLRTVATVIGGETHAPVVIADLLLSTMLVTLATPAGVAVFGIGDGVVGYDKDLRIEPTDVRGPEYLAYSLDSGAWTPNVKLHFSLDLEAVSTVVLATDGAQHLFSQPKSPMNLLTPDLRRRPAGLRWQLETLVRESAAKLDDDVTVALLVRSV